MIKKIRLLMEYNTFPVWTYNENNEIVDNDFPPEWQDDKTLEDAFMKLSDTYDMFFVDTQKEFRFVGYRTLLDKQMFSETLRRAISLLEQKNNGRYEIINDIHIP